MSQVCPHCGSAVIAGARFCGNCGAPLDTESLYKTTPVVAEPFSKSLPPAVAVPHHPPAPDQAPQVGLVFTSIPAGSDSSWAAGVSLVLGLVSLCAWMGGACGLPLPVIGIVFGLLGLRSSRHGLAVMGLVLNGLGLLGALVTVLFFRGLFAAQSLQNLITF